MDMILVKIFATALALSEVTTQPQAVKTHFDPVQDRTEVVQLLRDGCAHMRQAFDIESINLDDLIATALNDPKSPGGEIKAFHGINFADLNTAYHQFCKNESVDKPVVDLGQVIEFFNNAAADLPDQTRLKGRKLPSMTAVLDGKGSNFANVFEPRNRRVWVPLAKIPDLVQKAFVAAEDRRFFQHHGVDERGIIRAFIGNLADSGRPQGGSTITQQVVKNLLVGEDVTYERKIREMIVASRVESTLSKQEILELYLNSAYLGRGSWGVEMAARSYFGKSAKDLTLSRRRHARRSAQGPELLQSRSSSRSRQGTPRLRARPHAGRRHHLDGAKGPRARRAAEARHFRDAAARQRPALHRFSRPRGKGGRHPDPDRRALHGPFDDQRVVAARRRSGLAGGVGALRDVRRPHAVPRARGEYRRRDAEVERRETGRRNRGGAPSALPAWQQALQAVRLPLSDVHWDPAIVLDKGGKRGDGVIRVGLRDGRVLPLNLLTAQVRRALNLYDVVYVHVTETRPPPKPRNAAGAAVAAPAVPVGGQAQLRVRPTVQGAALVLENKTGRILAMAGSFSYMSSQLNRTAQTQRQPGSAMKPLTYLTALQTGLQPNTLVPDDPITLPPIGAAGVHGRDIIARDYGSGVREQDFWSPRNADDSSGGALTLRRGLENSVNVVTAHLLDGGISVDPEKSLDEVCATAVAAKIYTDCVRYYPFVLGAQPVRMIDLAAFYAAVANEGALPQPHAIESIEADGNVVFQYPNAPLPFIGAADRTAFYQLKTMLQGVVARGTARAIGALSPYVAGKTGTTEDAVDGWFVGFTNDVTIAVWVGYDNGDGKRRSLGGSATGARVALPIFEPIIQAIWAEGIAPKTPLNGPSAEAKRHLIDLPIDYASGSRVTGGGGFIEHFRLEADGRLTETQYQLVSQQDAYAQRNPEPVEQGSSGAWGWGGQGPGSSYYPGQQGWQQPQPRGLFAPWSSQNDSRGFWGGRF